MQLNPYLNFNGRCEEAFTFYEQRLGAKIEAVFKFRGAPMEAQCPPDWLDKVMHASISIDGKIVMGSDGIKGAPEEPRGFSLSLGAKDAAEAERLFSALSVNAIVKMPLQQTFWAERFGMLTDQFGIPWMVSCQPSQ
ncbi:VOC family protein [Undibacterium sp. TJN25]|uniref:VOC family protein n=1 Tax=Undibacterium sp. TJN25 TaxID=3413056 RepID=UPI003BEFF365